MPFLQKRDPDFLRSSPAAPEATSAGGHSQGTKGLITISKNLPDLDCFCAGAARSPLLHCGLLVVATASAEACSDWQMTLFQPRPVEPAHS